MTDIPVADVIVIRPATAADRAFLDSLDPRLIAEAAVPDIPAEAIAAFQAQYTKSALDDAKPGTTTLIAEDQGGERLGYVHLEPTDDMLAGQTVGYVSILAVTAVAEGRGVATRLMQAAEDWAARAGYPFLLLDVFASNTTARRFYGRRGYTEDSLRLRRKVAGSGSSRA